MNTINLKPCSGRVLIEPLPATSQTEGGIFIPESAKETPQEGVVRALGTERKTKDGEAIPFEMAVGDRVLLRKYGGQELKLDGKMHKLIEADEVLAVLS